MQARAQSFAGEVGQVITNLPKKETPNYVVSGSASVALTILTVAQSLGLTNTSWYLTFALATASAGVAINQYCEPKIFKDVANTSSNLFYAAKKAVLGEDAPRVSKTAEAAIQATSPAPTKRA